VTAQFATPQEGLSSVSKYTLLINTCVSHFMLKHVEHAVILLLEASKHLAMLCPVYTSLVLQLEKNGAQHGSYCGIIHR
jgi:hypothetical protein